MIKVTVYFDTRFHTVNGKQDSVSFAVDSVEKVKQVVSNANKMGNVSDIRIDHLKNGYLCSDYVFCMEMYENNQFIKRIFFIDNGNYFDIDQMSIIQDIQDNWEDDWEDYAVLPNRYVNIKHNYGWGF